MQITEIIQKLDLCKDDFVQRCRLVSDDDFFFQPTDLGKLTLRELCYFTIYHTYHHLHIIEQRLRPANAS